MKIKKPRRAKFQSQLVLNNAAEADIVENDEELEEEAPPTKPTRNATRSALTINDDEEEGEPEQFVRNTFQESRFTVNFGRLRQQELEGKTYHVAPMVMITEGVHAGSNGPLYYPSQELGKTPAVWNHKPLVVYHPTLNGTAISACEPVVINKRKVGLIMNTSYEPGKKGQPGRLKAEAWLDMPKLQKVDDRVYNAVKEGKMVEVSTGLFTDNKATPGTWNKEKYTHIATNYRPDHLAILPDEKGACSIKDGAGLMRNSEMSHDELRSSLRGLIKGRKTLPNGLSTPADSPWIQDVYGTFCIYQHGEKMFKQQYSNENGKLTLKGVPEEVTRRQTYRTMDGKVLNTGDPMDKDALIDALIANESTQWTEDDRETLNSFDEDSLEKMIPVDNNVTDKGKVGSADHSSDGKDDDQSDTIEDGKGQVKPKKQGSKSGATRNSSGKKKKDDGDDDDGNERTMNSAQTVEEFIEQAPPGMRDALMTMNRSYTQQKQNLIKQITANANNRFSQPKLNSMNIEELEGLVSLMGGRRQAPVRNNYAGLGDAGGGIDPVDNSAEEVEALPIPILNFERVNRG